MLRVESIEKKKSEDGQSQGERAETSKDHRGRDRLRQRQQHRRLPHPSDRDPESVEFQRDGRGDEAEGDRQMRRRQGRIFDHECGDEIERCQADCVPPEDWPLQYRRELDEVGERVRKCEEDQHCVRRLRPAEAGR